MTNIKQLVSTIKLDLEDKTQEGFKKLFTQVDYLKVKQSVDRMGIDRFIEHCARMAAVSGAVAGGGGAITIALGIPLDLVNLISQQIRVTLGIIYYTRGAYEITFDEFISILATALQVEAGVAITKNLVERVTERLMIRLGTKAAGRLIPIVGGAIGGAANYLFIKRMAESVRRMQPRYQQVMIHIE